jgi:hypothetical protein
MFKRRLLTTASLPVEACGDLRLLDGDSDLRSRHQPRLKTSWSNKTAFPFVDSSSFLKHLHALGVESKSWSYQGHLCCKRMCPAQTNPSSFQSLVGLQITTSILLNCASLHSFDLTPFHYHQRAVRVMSIQAEWRSPPYSLHTEAIFPVRLRQLPGYW